MRKRPIVDGPPDLQARARRRFFHDYDGTRGHIRLDPDSKPAAAVTRPGGSRSLPEVVPPRVAIADGRLRSLDRLANDDGAEAGDSFPGGIECRRKETPRRMSSGFLFGHAAGRFASHEHHSKRI